MPAAPQNFYKKLLGRIGENKAEKHLKSIGYKILEKNFTTDIGEIDLVAKDGEYIVFVEVKTRTNSNYGAPIDAITYLKRKHMLKTIKYYLFLNKLENNFIRIDVIEIYNKNNKYFVHHIKNIVDF